METLKNYLETMFMNLPNTAEVRRAKDELWQMMEDKYAELTGEGKSENEAIGIIIAEFGNLDEIAEELGIEAVVKPHEYSAPDREQQNENSENPTYGAAQPSRKLVTLEEVKQYLHAAAGSAFCIALGVMLCIMSVICPITMGSLDLDDTVGVLGMFVMIAVAVGIFVFNGVRMSKFDYLSKELCSIDFATSNYVEERKEHYRGTYALLLTIGIVLCVICCVPSIIMDSIHPVAGMMDPDDIGAIALFAIVGIGVFMIVLTCCTQGSFKNILKLNDVATMGGNYKVEKKEEYISPVVGEIMSLYWPTVSCIYLCWSFITFDWWVTWIIWPVAGIASAVINSIWKK